MSSLFVSVFIVALSTPEEIGAEYLQCNLEGGTPDCLPYLGFLFYLVTQRVPGPVFLNFYMVEENTG